MDGEKRKWFLVDLHTKSLAMLLRYQVWDARRVHGTQSPHPGRPWKLKLKTQTAVTASLWAQTTSVGFTSVIVHYQFEVVFKYGVWEFS